MGEFATALGGDLMPVTSAFSGLSLVLMALLGWRALLAEDVVIFRLDSNRDASPITKSGRIVVQAADGGLLFEEPSGRYWRIEPDMLARRETSEAPFQHWDASETKRALLVEFPGFRVHQTQHYTLVYDASEAYARWCGSLFERLLEAYRGFWRGKGFVLEAPAQPLVVVIFGDSGSFTNYAKRELGDAFASVAGYFHLQTNRVVMQDLTGRQGNGRDRRGSRAEISAMLRSPEAALNVATVVHEATHQAAYNTGMHARLADIPLWVSEGVAVFFETPDVENPRGWRKVDVVNPSRLGDFEKYLTSRPADSLSLLIADDHRFRNSDTAVAAYAEAWALNYFLLQVHPREYVQYLKHLAEKQPLVWSSPEERIKEFEASSGLSLIRLDAELIRYYQRRR